MGVSVLSSTIVIVIYLQTSTSLTPVLINLYVAHFPPQVLVVEVRVRGSSEFSPVQAYVVNDQEGTCEEFDDLNIPCSNYSVGVPDISGNTNVTVLSCPLNILMVCHTFIAQGHSYCIRLHLGSPAGRGGEHGPDMGLSLYTDCRALPLLFSLFCVCGFYMRKIEGEGEPGMYGTPPTRGHLAMPLVQQAKPSLLPAV